MIPLDRRIAACSISIYIFFFPLQHRITKPDAFSKPSTDGFHLEGITEPGQQLGTLCPRPLGAPHPRGSAGTPAAEPARGIFQPRQDRPQHAPASVFLLQTPKEPAHFAPLCITSLSQCLF